MIAFDTSHTLAARSQAPVTSRLMGLFAQWTDTRSTRKALNRLSDRELDDIGLCRGDIERIARGSF